MTSLKCTLFCTNQRTKKICLLCYMSECYERSKAMQIAQSSDVFSFLRHKLDFYVTECQMLASEVTALPASEWS
jgi:hypothetical protein